MHKILTALVLLLAATAATAQVSTGTRFGFRSATDPAYGAACGTETTGTTGSDHTAFQAALDAANTAGGGTVYVPACSSGSAYYYFSTGISIPSNVKLLCQQGVTFKSPTNAGQTHLSGKSDAAAFVGFFGASNAGIEGCTIDQLSVVTASNQSNGIVATTAVPATALVVGTGARSTDITVRGVTVRANSHSAGPYLFWARQADGIKVLDSTFDGNQTTNATSDQAGVELVATTNADISGNSFIDIGNFAIDVAAYGAGTFANYHSRDITIRGNSINVAKYGIGLGATADGAANNAYMQNIVIADNKILDPWLIGIHVRTGTQPGSSTAMYRNIVIADNAVNSSVLTNDPYGMKIDFGGANTTATNFVVEGNTFLGGEGVDATGQTGLRLSHAKNVQFIGNSWAGGSLASAAPIILSENAPVDIRFVGNYFGQADSSTIRFDGGDRWVWTGNTFDQYSEEAGAAALQNADGAVANGWIVTDNVFVEGTTGGGYVMNGTVAKTSGWLWRDNQARELTGPYTGARQANGLWDGTCPTSGAAINDNSHGCVKINIAGTTVTVTNAQVRAGSRIVATQATGTPSVFTTAAANGSFVLTMAVACAVANCDFYYEIFN